MRGTGREPTSLREALRGLERDGLVENILNRGIVVARVSLAQAQSIYEVRAVLEGLAARLFAERATDAQVKQLEASLKPLSTAAGRYEPGPFIAATSAFYALLLEGAGNPTLALSLRQLHTRVSQLRLVSLQRPGRLEVVVKELRRLVRRIKARDVEQAQHESIVHVQNAAAATLDAMRAAEAAA